MKIKILLFSVFYVLSIAAYPQASATKDLPTAMPEKPGASEIYESIKKLNFLGSVLYIAAHPDDENTRLISYLSNDVKARTAYLSITRGDGGQNLIGSELSELLGVIRTQELLEARKIDGGEQLFTRANDFGFSKHPDETFNFWGKEAVLSDVVLAIRRFQPDVIINRFDHRTPGSTHGHHTASAILGMEAFDLAGRRSAFMEHFEVVKPWQPKRIFHNASWWFYNNREEFEEANKHKNLLKINTGSYYPSYGLSNGEIAALSRSKHQSQGFGSIGNRGEETEYLEFLKGDFSQNAADIFEGIDTSWNRIEGGKAIGDILHQVEKDFDFRNPAASIPELVKAYKLLKDRTDHWSIQKTEEIKNIIAACAGLFMEAIAETQSAAQGETINVSFEIINRSVADVELVSVKFRGKSVLSEKQKLQFNKRLTFKENVTLPDSEEYSSPYWLREKGTPGLYHVDDMTLIGKPETGNGLPVRFHLKINNEDIVFEKSIAYKYNNPATGEVYQPFRLLPEATVSLTQNVIIFPDNKPQQVQVSVRGGKDNISGTVHLEHPKGWKVSASQNFSLTEKGEEKKLVFTVTPPENQNEGILKAVVETGNEQYDKELITIQYPHIPLQNVLLPAEAKISRIALQKEGINIGYIEGAGDAVAKSLEQIGYKVTFIAPEEITEDYLRQFDAVVVGVRAYNVVKELQFKQTELFSYVENGGNLIVQYNVSRGLVTDNIAPYKLQLSRDRVTDETSPVTFLEPNHKVLNSPNKITAADFENWIQERGLYFPNEWDSRFTPILQMNDPNETPVNGALLITKHGRGNFVYTGLSFFRELPAGVSGAYRLFVNLLSL